MTTNDLDTAENALEAPDQTINYLLSNLSIDEQEDAKKILEGTSGSAWMFYNHYNPTLLDAMQKVLVGHKVEDVIDSLLEMDKEAEESMCGGGCEKCKEGTCPTGKKLGCSTQKAAAE